MDLTVKELAARERVHELTVRRWVRTGIVESRRTPGGQIRIVAPGPETRAPDRPPVYKR